MARARPRPTAAGVATRTTLVVTSIRFRPNLLCGPLTSAPRKGHPLRMPGPTARIIGLATLLCASPALALDAHYEGLREFVRGQSSCSTQPSQVIVDVGSDGGVRGDVFTTDGALRFFGTVNASGKLFASYR